jgi:solute carrier family 35, member C2
MDRSIDHYTEDLNPRTHIIVPPTQPHATQLPNPRRNYQRQETGLLHENKEHSGAGDDPGSMSESEEHEMDDIGSDVDEETGLTGVERQKNWARNRRHGDLAARIAGDGKIIKNESADKTVIRSLLLNGALIGLWYLFSLSISIVSSSPWGSTKAY